MFRQSLLALAAAVCYSVMAALVKHCSNFHSPEELVFYRSIFGVLSIYLLTRKPGYSIKTKYPWRHFVRSFLGILCVYFWFYTLGELPFGTCMTLSYTAPIFLALTYIIFALVAHRSPPWMLVFSILVGFAGIVLVMKPTADVRIVPALICLGSAMLEVPIKLQMKAMGQLQEPSYRIVFYFCLLGTIFSALMVVTGTGFHMGDGFDWLCLSGMVILSTLGQFFVTRSFAYGNVLLSACLGFSAIPMSIFIGWVAFDETTDTLSVLGMVIIIVVGIVATVHTRKEELSLKEK